MEDKKEEKESKENINSSKEKSSEEKEAKPPRQITEKEKKEFLNQIRNLKKTQELIKKGELAGIKTDFKFWGTQPVPQFNKPLNIEFGPILKDTNIENIPKEPYTLPEGFEWKDINLNQTNDVDKLYEFLKSNYINDESHLFGSDYSKDFLKWFLSPPGMYDDWIISVVKEDKIKNKKKIIGFISAIPTKLSINNNEIKMAKVCFLCVKKEFRNKRLTPVLIKEITRRINSKNIWQGIYKTFAYLPKAFTKSQYHYRVINLKKLLDVQYTYLPNKMSLGNAIKKYELPDEPKISGFRKMEKKDLEQIYNLILLRNKKYKIYEILDKSEVEHWLLPRNNIVYTYVLEDEEHKITDFCSFYTIQRTILNQNKISENSVSKYKKIIFAYELINLNTSISMKELLRSAVILAKQNGFDAYHCIDYKENSDNFKELLFMEKIGKMKYYLYNFVIPETSIDDVSLMFI